MQEVSTNMPITTKQEYQKQSMSEFLLNERRSKSWKKSDEETLTLTSHLRANLKKPYNLKDIVSQGSRSHLQNI